MRLRPSAHRCSCSRNPPIPANGAQIGYRRIGNGRPLLVLNGFAATSADWDPSFIDRLASSNELILLDNRGIGSSTDNGKPFDIAQLSDDAARVIETLGFERTNVLGWSMGGFIAQTLALNDPARVRKLILLSTDPGGTAAELASPAILGQLTDTSGTPHQQARRLLSPAVSQRSRRVHLPRIRRRCGRRACEALSQPGGSADCGDGRMAPRWHLRSAP